MSKLSNASIDTRPVYQISANGHIACAAKSQVRIKVTTASQDKVKEAELIIDTNSVHKSSLALTHNRGSDINNLIFSRSLLTFATAWRVTLL